MKTRILSIIIIHTWALFVSASATFATPMPTAFETTLETLRQKYHLPALAAAVVRGNEILAVGTVGVRKADTTIPVTLQDHFFIGSCTKSMTATVAARLVEQGQISWTTTIAEAFPQFTSIHPDYRNVTLEQLLSHTGGVPEDVDLELFVPQQPLDLPGQRLRAIEPILAKPPQTKPGSEVIYSNAGYVIAAAMLEQATGVSWETLMKQMLFMPLGMTSAGFGPPATPGNVDQPWGHQEAGNRSKPVPPGKGHLDKATLIGPAGTVHCSIQDFATYAMFHLQQAHFAKPLLTAQSFRKLHTPVKEFRRLEDAQYASGWVISQQPGDSEYVWHDGSDTINYAVILLAPAQNLAVVAVTNIAGKRGMEGIYQTVRTLMQAYGQTKVTVFPRLSNWMRIAGMGVGVVPVYPGSDKLKIAPAPFGMITYTTTYVDFFLNAAGLGIRLKEPAYTNLRLDIGIRPGEIRKPDTDQVKDVLAGTPELIGIIQPFVSFGRELSFGIFSADLSATVRYLPITAEYAEAGRADQDYDGLLVDTTVDLSCIIPPTYRFLLNTDIGATWMNAEYAEAFHGVQYPTATLEKFQTGSGIRDIHANFGATYFISPRFGVTVQGGVMKLLGDASDSPLTKQDLVPQVSLMLLYNF